MKTILSITALSLLFAVPVHAQRIKQFKTDFPELIGTWSFEADPAGVLVPYQMALWVPEDNAFRNQSEGVLTWYQCRTKIKLKKIPRDSVPLYKITSDSKILANYEFFRISDEGEFKLGYCSNRLGDQWPEYLLREIFTGKYHIAGHLISQKRIQELKVMDQKNPYEAPVSETSRRQSGNAVFKIFSEVKRTQPDYNTAPALKYAAERLGYSDEIENARGFLDNPGKNYSSRLSKEKREYCDSLGKLSQSLMALRLNGAPRNVANRLVDQSDPYQKKAVEFVFAFPLGDTEEDQIKFIEASGKENIVELAGAKVVVGCLESN